MAEPEAFLNGKVTLHCGDMLSVLPTLDDNSVDSVCCDPPYHLASIVKRFGAETAAPAQHGTDGAFARASKGFMGKAWDGGEVAFKAETWRHVLRVLKPGGYIVAFSSSRTFARMAVAIEDAGFITHPLIGRLFDQAGEIGQFLDGLTPAQLGAFCQIMDRNDPVAGLLGYIFGSGFPKATRLKAPGLDGYRYGAQALKPALEPIFCGQKPFSEATGTANVLRGGTGAVNISGCRIGTEGGTAGAGRGPQGDVNGDGLNGSFGRPVEGLGRWPANLVTDGSDAVVAAFPETGISSGGSGAASQKTALGGAAYGEYSHATLGGNAGGLGDSGSAARFFYASKADSDSRAGSNHPTVKNLDLIRWLCRLVTPPGGTVLDCFAGTGTTGEAAFREGMRAVLIEREAEYANDIRRRMALVMAGPDERKRAIVKAKGRPDDLSGTLFASPLEAAE